MGCGFFKYIKYLNFDLRFQTVSVTIFKIFFIDMMYYFLQIEAIHVVVLTVQFSIKLHFEISYTFF